MCRRTSSANAGCDLVWTYSWSSCVSFMEPQARCACAGISTLARATRQENLPARLRRRRLGGGGDDIPFETGHRLAAVVLQVGADAVEQVARVGRTIDERLVRERVVGNPRKICRR